MRLGMFSIVVLLFFVFSIGVIADNNSTNLVNLTNNSKDSFDPTVDIYFFHGIGCPHCAKLKEFLYELDSKYSDLNIREFETYYNEENKKFFSQMAEAYNTQVQGVPTMFIGENVIVGYSSKMNAAIEKQIRYCIEFGCDSPAKKLNQGLEVDSSVLEVVKDKKNKKLSGKKDSGRIGFTAVFLTIGLGIIVVFVFNRKKYKKKCKKRKKN